MGNDVIIRSELISKKFGEFYALKKVSMTLLQGQQYVIKGHSGSGKSTLLYLFGGMDRQTTGKIWFKNQLLNEMDDNSLATYRNRSVGFVFQFHYLLSSMNCLDNILLPTRIGELYTSKLEREMRDLATRLGVDHCLKKYPYEISGGEQQRISILRALVLRPDLLLCDEPTGNLDSENTEKVTMLLKELAASYNSTLVIVTHDDDVSSHFNNRFTLQDGTLLN